MEVNNSARILLIDDDERIREVLLRMLSVVNPNYQPLCATNGKEAIALCENEKFDIIVCDLQMPRMGGEEFILRNRRKKSLNRETPIIVLSGHFDPKTIKNIASMTTALIVKSNNSEEIVEKIDVILKNELIHTSKLGHSF